MKLRFPESEIRQIAQRYRYPREESKLLDLKTEVQRVGYLNKSQLRLVARWKTPRSAGNVERNENGYAKEITSWAFSAKEERSRIEVLTLLDGVLWPNGVCDSSFVSQGVLSHPGFQGFVVRWIGCAKAIFILVALRIFL